MKPSWPPPCSICDKPAAQKKRRPLGGRQVATLKSLSERNGGVWFWGCGWKYGTPRETETIFASLAKHGLVRCLDETFWTYGKWQITAVGRRYVEDGGWK